MDEEFFSDNVRIAAELVFPRRRAQHHHRRAPGGRGILRKQCPTQGRIHSEHVEVVAGHQISEEHVTLQAGEGEMIDSHDFRESRILFPEILKFLPREQVAVPFPVHPRE